MGVGIDIVLVSRIANGPSFVDFCLSDNEKEILAKRKNKEEFLAGRFAAKEAFLKALGVGIGHGIAFKDIDVRYENNGQPVLYYDGNSYDVSISHDGGYAVAVVITK